VTSALLFHNGGGMVQEVVSLGPRAGGVVAALEHTAEHGAPPTALRPSSLHIQPTVI
jgi:hypothetical protein